MTTKTIRRPDLVAVNIRARDAFGLHAASHYSCGGWLVTEVGALRIEADGSVTMRPTPWPWTRPSVAALPHLPVRR